MRKLVSAVLASIILATAAPAAALPALAYDPTQTNPYYPAYPTNLLWQQQQLNNVSSSNLKKLLVAGFLARLFTGGNQQQPTTAGGTVQTVDAGTVPGQRTGGIVSTPSHQSRGVRIYVPPGGDQSNGLFLLTPAADPPYPLEGKPVNLRLGLTLGTGVQVVKMAVNGQQVAPGATVTLEQSAVAGQYRKPFVVAVRRMSDGAAGVVQGYVDYAVAAFGGWATGQGGANSATYSTPASPVGQIEANQDLYISNADARSADYSVQASGKITKLTKTPTGWDMTVEDDAGKSIVVRTGRLPEGYEVGREVAVSGKLRRGADGKLVIDANAVTDKVSAAKAKKSDTSAMSALRAKAAENMAKLNPVGSLADPPKPASWGTVASGSGGDGENVQPLSSGNTNTSRPTYDDLFRNILHAVGLADVPVVPAELLNEQSPGMRSARAVFGTLAVSLGMVIGSLVAGIGLGPALGMAIAAGVIGVGIAGMTGDLSDIGSFLLGDGFMGYLLSNHPGRLALEVGLGALTAGVVPLIGRALMPLLPRSIAAAFDGGATRIAQAFSERISVAGGADATVKAAAVEVAGSIGGRAGMKITGEMAAANPRLSAGQVARIRNAARKTLTNEYEAAGAAARQMAQAEATNTRIATLRAAGIELPSSVSEVAVPRVSRGLEAARTLNQALRETAKEVSQAQPSAAERASEATARKVAYGASAVAQGVTTGELRHGISGGENALSKYNK